MSLDYESLNPGIRRLVSWLNYNGFTTTDSGDGVTNVITGMEYALEYPHVVLRVEPTEDLVATAKSLCRMLREHGMTIEPVSMPHRPSIQATYDPTDDTAVIVLTGIDDQKMFDRGPVSR